MSNPIKPWEQNRFGMHNGTLLNSSAPMMTTQHGAGRIRNISSATMNGVPQLPPRPGANSYNGNVNPYMMGASSYSPRSYGTGYNSYSFGGMGMGGYGGYSSYGGMGLGSMYNNYSGGMYGGNGFGLGPENRFIQLAEESTRPAFQGIESLVQAFGSIAMMLDSTFFAITSSFRAVLGVAENFGRIRTMFGQVWSSFAILRFFKWVYRKLMSMFGVKIAEDVGKEAWAQALNEGGTQNPPASWPIFMFLGLLISAPYVISKLLPPFVDKRNPKNWAEPGRKIRVQYPFQATNSQELSVRSGEEILIAPKSIQLELQLHGTGWICAASNNNYGVVPINYLQTTAPTRNNTPQNTTPQTTIPQNTTPSTGVLSEIANYPMLEKEVKRIFPNTSIPTTSKVIVNKNVTTEAVLNSEFVEPQIPEIKVSKESLNEIDPNIPISSQNELDVSKNN